MSQLRCLWAPLPGSPKGSGGWGEESRARAAPEAPSGKARRAARMAASEIVATELISEKY